MKNPTHNGQLIYGMAWCDGQNHLFSMIIGELFGEAHTFALMDHETKQSVHTTVMMDFKGLPVIIDAWSDVPIFTLNKNSIAEQAGIPEWSDVSGDVMLERLEGASLAVAGMKRQVYEDGERRIHATSQLVPFGRFNFWEVSDTQPDKMSSPFQTYLKARVYHLLGHTSPARQHYQTVIESPATSELIRRAANWFSVKLNVLSGV